MSARSYRISHGVVAPLSKALWRPTITGRDNVPPTGGVLIASNHLSFIDSFAIPIAAPRPVAFLAKSDYFTGTGVSGAVRRAFFANSNAIPVDRHSSRAAQESLDAALLVLRQGGGFGIYPEGTRSRDGRLYRGRTGVAHLALTAGAPVVPVGLTGTDKLQPVGARLPRVVPITVEFGQPIEVAGRYDGVPLGKARRLLTDEIMAAIQRLSGQQPAGVYNDRPADH